MAFSLFFPLGYVLAPISSIATYIICYFTGRGIGYIVDKIINGNKKLEFINKNSIITEKIQNYLIKIIQNQLDENIIKEKIIIYNKENFDNKIEKIKNKVLEKNYLKKLQKIITKNFNILLVGCTNARKSIVINEFLKLNNDKKAKESEDGPTETVDFTSYKGINNNKTYTLYDTME